jgi:pimeloyl-ACP methyl ester carboxylesterase
MTPVLPPFPLFVDGGTRVMVYSLTVSRPVAPPVVFLHGWGLSPQSYAPYLHALSERLSCDVLAPALPGFGGSDPLPSADDSALLTHLTVALPELNLDTPPILIGHSLGAALAARVASQVNPPPLDPRLVLISPAGVRHGRGGGLGKAMSMALELRHDLPHDPLARLQDAGPSFLRHPRAAFQAGWTASQIDIHGDLARLVKRRARVFLVTADEDRVTPHDDARSVPGVHVEAVRGTHGWLLSHPQEAAQLVERLLTLDSQGT